MKKTRRSTERRRNAPRRSPRGSRSSARSSSSSPASLVNAGQDAGANTWTSDLLALLENFAGRGRRAQIAADEILESFSRRASDVLNEPDDV